MWIPLEKKSRPQSENLFIYLNKAVELLKEIQTNTLDDEVRLICSTALNHLERVKLSMPQFSLNARNRGLLGLDAIIKNIDVAQKAIDEYPGKIRTPYSWQEKTQQLMLLNAPLVLLSISLLVLTALFANVLLSACVALFIVMPIFFQLNKARLEDFAQGLEVSPFEAVTKELNKCLLSFQRLSDRPERTDDIFKDCPLPDVGL